MYVATQQCSFPLVTCYSGAAMFFLSGKAGKRLDRDQHEISYTNRRLKMQT